MTDGSPISQNVKTCEKTSTVEDDQAVLGALVEIRSRLAQSVERLTAEREVVGSIPRAGPILRVLK